MHSREFLARGAAIMGINEKGILDLSGPLTIE